MAAWSVVRPCLVLIVLQAGCMRMPEAARTAGPTAVAATPAVRFARALLQETNRARVAHRRTPLYELPQLDAAADDQAAMLALRLTLEHGSPLPGQATPLDRVQRRGVFPVASAENVAEVSVAEEAEPEAIAARLVEVWMNSPGHRENLLNPRMKAFGSAVRLARGVGGERLAFGVQEFVAIH